MNAYISFLVFSSKYPFTSDKGWCENYLYKTTMKTKKDIVNEIYNSKYIEVYQDDVPEYIATQYIVDIKIESIERRSK